MLEILDVLESTVYPCTYRELMKIYKDINVILGISLYLQGTLFFQ